MEQYVKLSLEEYNRLRTIEDCFEEDLSSMVKKEKDDLLSAKDVYFESVKEVQERVQKEYQLKWEFNEKILIEIYSRSLMERIINRRI